MSDSLYPQRYHLPDLTAHVVALLERRRAGLETWDEQAEATLLAEVGTALDDARRQFLEVAADEGYWTRTEHALRTVALPRYFKLAKAQHELEGRAYGVWRGGDVLSRAAYAAAGLVLAVVVWRTALPDWLEPLPLGLFLFGPLLPDLQAGSAKRKYARELAKLVEAMREEQADRTAYQPFGVEDGVAPVDGNSTSAPERVKDPPHGDRTS